MKSRFDQSVSNRPRASMFRQQAISRAFAAVSIAVLAIPGIAAASANPMLSNSMPVAPASPQDCAGPLPADVPIGWDLVFCDAFEDNANGWLEGHVENDTILGDRQVAGGVLNWQLEASQPATVEDFGDDRALGDSYVAVDVGWVQPPTGAPQLALQFRRQDPDNFYSFTIDPSVGMYTLEIRYQGRWETLLDWQQSEAIRSQRLNRLAVLTQGDLIALFANGQRIAQLNDNRIATGFSGATVYLAQGDRVHVTIDNYEERAPAIGMQPPSRTQGAWGSSPVRPTAGTSDTWTDQVTHAPNPVPSPPPAGPLSVDEVPLPPDWPLLAWDDFTDPLSGWVMDRTDATAYGAYADGSLQLAFRTESFKAPNTFSGRQFADFRVDVDVQSVTSDLDVFYELILRYEGRYVSGFYYYVIFRHDGAYQVSLRDGSDTVILQDYTISPCLITGPGAVNHLTAVMQGPRLDLYANGCYLTSISNDRLSWGDIGLAAGRFKGPGEVDIRFDNFRVYGTDPLPPAVFGDVVNSTFSKEELIARGEFLGLNPFPKDPSISQYPGGTKRIECFVPYQGMAPGRQISETAYIDGSLAWSEGPLPWAQRAREQAHLAFGVYMRTFKMQLGGPLPTGHWEWRLYVDGVPVTRSFFGVGVDTPPPAPLPLSIGSAPPPPRPSLPPAEDSLAQALALSAQGRSAEAIPYCDRAMAVAPNSTQLMAQCAALHEAAGHREWARMWRQTAHNLDGLALLQQPTAADTPVTPAPAAEAIATPYPGNEYVAQANALYEQKDYQSVIDLALRHLPEVTGADAVELWLNLGRAYFQLGYGPRDEAILHQSADALNQLLALEPNDARAHDYLGRIAYRLGDADGALPLLEKATALDAALPSPYLFRGYIYYDRADYTLAVPQFQEYLDLGGKASEAYAYQMIGRSYYHAAWAANALEDDFAKALPALNKALDLDPSNANVCDYLGRIYYFQDDYGLAVAFLERASQLDPDLRDPYYLRGRIAYSQGDNEGAVALLQRYLDMGPTSESWKAAAYIYSGWSLYKLTRYDEAEQALLKAEELSPSDGNLYGGLGWVYADTGRCPEAIPMFEKAIGLDPAFEGWQTGLAKCRQ